jgi:Rrf2 family protein
MLTRAADYAVRVMIHMATLPEGTRVQRSMLAQATEVPDSFMSKVLQELVRARMIASRRGVDGGFQLAVAAQTVSLLDVVQAIDGPMQLNQCVGANGNCDRAVHCAAHLVWQEAQDAAAKVLKTANIADLARFTLMRHRAVNVSPVPAD